MGWHEIRQKKGKQGDINAYFQTDGNVIYINYVILLCNIWFENVISIPFFNKNGEFFFKKYLIEINYLH